MANEATKMQALTDIEKLYLQGALSMAIKSVDRLARAKEAEGKMSSAKTIREDQQIYENIKAKIRLL